jgi:hypothetical protein
MGQWPNAINSVRFRGGDVTYDERHSLAWHEAGHAVAHVLLDRPPFKFVTILADDERGSAGALHGHRPAWSGSHDELAQPSLDWVIGEVVTLLAGPEAEYRYGYRKKDRPEHWMTGWHLGALPDREVVASLVEHYVTGDDEMQTRAFLGWAEARTKGLVRSPAWAPAHGRVVKALLVQQTLTGEDVIGLVLGAN